VVTMRHAHMIQADPAGNYVIANELAPG